MNPESHWHFHCPECGFGSVELSYLASDHEIHCEVCLDDDGRIVLLRRWLTDETPHAADPSDGSPRPRAGSTEPKSTPQSQQARQRSGR